MKYIHLRNHDATGIVLQNGGICVGWERVDKKFIRMSFARCSNKDVYRKPLARTIVEGRMRVGKHALLEAPEGHVLEAVVREFGLEQPVNRG